MAVRSLNADRSRALPYNIDAEQNVVGAAMLDRTAAARITERLRSASFSDGKCRTVFEAIRAVIDAGDPVDATTVADRLTRTGRLDDAGGKAFLVHVVSSCPAPSNADAYAAIVQRNAELRDLYAVAQHVAADVVAGEDPAHVRARLLEATATADPASARTRLLTLTDLDAEPTVGYIAEDFVQDRALNVLYGPTGAYKSFLALDLACCVCAGLPWFGDRGVRSGPVVYIAAEGVAGLRQRLAAWRLDNASADLGSLRIVSEGVQLLDRDAVSDLIVAARDLEPRLIVVDTFARCIVGADENSARDVGLAVASLDRIRVELQAGVLAVHHTGYDQTRERGSTALRAAADAAIAVRSTGESIVVDVVKSKDAAAPTPLHLRRRVVELPGLATVDGRPLTSCVLETIGGPIPTASAASESRVADVLREHRRGGGRTSIRACRDAVRGAGLRASNGVIDEIRREVFSEEW